MARKKKVLLLSTGIFPYGKDEAFLENEISALSEAFDEIIILPRIKKDGIRFIPENVKVDDRFLDKQFNTKSLFSRNLLIVIKLYLSQLFNGKLLIHLRNKHAVVSYLSLVLYFREKLKELITEQKNADIYCYSFWMDEPSLAFSLIKNKKIKRFVSRAHRYDIYENEWEGGFIPFRSYQIKHTNHVFPVSNKGKEYIIDRYSNRKQNITTLYLGVKDLNLNPEPKTNEPFHFVSCSYVSDRKRVDMILRIIEKLGVECFWTHFGDGDNFEQLKKDCQNLEKIKVNLPGFTMNAEVLEFYATTPITFLIHMSISEGIPVSMMEAQMFGIPVAATDVGGVSEIVNSENGLLFNVDENEDQIAKEIRDVIYDNERYEKMRTSSRKNAKVNFDAENNYKKFLNVLLNE